MSEPNFTIETELKGIPFGALTLEQIIASTEGQEVIRLLKQTSDDPFKLIGPFLVAYQFIDMKQQLKDRNSYLPLTPEINNKLIHLATRHVVLTLSDIVNEIGEERLDVLTKILSPDTAQQFN